MLRLSARRAVGTVALVAGVVAATGLCELLARRVPGLQPIERQLRLHVRAIRRAVQHDPDVGSILAPNQSHEVDTRDFSVVRQTDARGFVNREPWPRSARAVVLGDSFTIGEGVGIDASFPQVLARLVGTPVLNLGLPGAGPERQYRIFRKFGAELEPDYVISVVYPAKAIDNDRVFRLWLASDRTQTFEEYRGSHDKARSRHAWYDPHRWVLYQEASARIEAWLGLRAPNRWPTPSGDEVYLDRATTRYLAQGWRDDQAELDRLSTSLRKIAEAAVQRNARFAVALIPSKEELFLRDDPRMGGLANAFRSALESGSLPTIDLYAPLDAARRHASPYFKRDIHLNLSGNRIVARELADWVHRNPPLPRDPRAPGLLGDSGW